MIDLTETTSFRAIPAEGRGKPAVELPAGIPPWRPGALAAPGLAWLRRYLRRASLSAGRARFPAAQGATDAELARLTRTRTPRDMEDVRAEFLVRHSLAGLK